MLFSDRCSGSKGRRGGLNFKEERCGFEDVGEWGAGTQ